MVVHWDCVLWSGGSQAGIHWFAGISWHYHVEVRIENVTCYSSPTTPTLFSWIILGCGAFIGTCHASPCLHQWKGYNAGGHGISVSESCCFHDTVGERTWNNINYLSSRYFPLPLNPLDSLSERFYHLKEKEWMMKLVIRLRPTNKEMGKTGVVTPRYALFPSLS